MPQNTLAAALKEWGMIKRTIHAARYLSDPLYRREISRQLNKGESLHALRRELHYAQQGTIVRPHLTDQTEQAWCLTLLTNFGTINVDYEAELADGWRPLRATLVNESGSAFMLNL
ncbi:transposase [Actinomadura madurae]|nr:transposase [Actinomadura madurae]